jgi:antitoxin component YwqK of YwqJK toxin-antitoxin module
MDNYITLDLIKYIISDYVQYFDLIHIRVLQLNKYRITNKFDTDVKIGGQVSNNITNFNIKTDRFKLLIYNNLQNHENITKKSISQTTYIDNNIIFNCRDNLNEIVISRKICIVKNNLCTNLNKITTVGYHRNGLTKIYWENGNLRQIYKAPYCDEINGRCLFWSEDKALLAVENYKDGFKTGLQTYYNNNGNKILEYTQINDELEGDYKEWDSNCKLITSKFYVDGVERNKTLHKFKKYVSTKLGL